MGKPEIISDQVKIREAQEKYPHSKTPETSSTNV